MQLMHAGSAHQRVTAHAGIDIVVAEFAYVLCRVVTTQ